LGSRAVSWVFSVDETHYGWVERRVSEDCDWQIHPGTTIAFIEQQPEALNIQ
jgi:hypothetical protein